MLKITRKEGLMKKLALAMFLAFCCLSVAQAGPNHNNGLAAKSKGQWKDAENYFKLGLLYGKGRFFLQGARATL